MLCGASARTRPHLRGCVRKCFPRTNPALVPEDPTGLIQRTAQGADYLPIARTAPPKQHAGRRGYHCELSNRYSSSAWLSLITRPSTSPAAQRKSARTETSWFCLITVSISARQFLSCSSSEDVRIEVIEIGTSLTSTVIISLQEPHLQRKGRPRDDLGFNGDVMTRACPPSLQCRSPMARQVAAILSSTVTPQEEATHLLLDCTTILPLTLARCWSGWVCIIHATRHPCDVSVSMPQEQSS